MLTSPYDLPPLLTCLNGKRVLTAEDWRKHRRPEMLKLLEEYMYGPFPPRPAQARVELLQQRDDAFAGLAIRKEYRLILADRHGESFIDFLLYLPKAAVGPVPVFLGLNFNGNHTVTPEPDIIPPARRCCNEIDHGVLDNRPGEKKCGADVDAWQIEQLLRRGYALGTAGYCDIFPDHSDALPNSIYRLFHSPGELERQRKKFGAISAWAWGLSRLLDVLESEPAVNSRQVMTIGHSRLGKTALWAAACDERFAAAFGNNSGHGGAALTRRRPGIIRKIQKFSYYWFSPRLMEFIDRENELPVDQHMLLALIAPRPAYIASSVGDVGTDPTEFLGIALAQEVYKLFGSEGLGTMTMPPPHKPIHADLGYHIREGKHAVLPLDWEYYLAFADRLRDRWKKM